MGSASILKGALRRGIKTLPRTPKGAAVAGALLVSIVEREGVSAGEQLLEEISGDASAREIDDGDEVRVFNDLGAVICRAAVRSSVRPGVVSMPKGAWRRSSRNGATSTALCPADVNVVAGGACFNDARVEIAAIPAVPRP